MVDRKRLPPLNALRAFEAAARHRSFKEAAAELFVTPTAVSHQIRNLEAFMGVSLFDRNGSAVSLTRAGERFFPVLRDGFDRIAQSVAELQREEDVLTVSVTQAFASRVLVPALAQLRRLHPGVTLHIHATERLVDLRKAEADLCVRYGPERARPVHSELLWRDSYIPVAAPAWLAGREPALAPQVLAQADLLHYDWKNSGLQGPTWASWMAAAGLPGFDNGRCIGFSEESHAIAAALDGAGVCLASSVLVGRELRAGRLLQVHPLGLTGFAYHAEYVEDHPRLALVRKVVHWVAGLPSAEGEGGPNAMPA